MKKMIRGRIASYLMGLSIVFVITLCGASAVSAQPQNPITSMIETERNDGGYYTIIDEKKNPIDYTARILNKGDEFISAKNMRYQITSIKGDNAHARLLGKEAEAKIASPPINSIWSQLIARRSTPSIGIYHTHSDESYIPSDGAESIYANGGIFKVGKVLDKKLRDIGFEVNHSRRPHDPHDINAYYRSRRTAVELLQKRPNALFDIHRDAVPPQVYAANVKGQDITRVKFVVGRTNPNFQANLEFAKQLKTAVDKKHPDVVQGILIAKSDFNQDLAPRSMLIEVGAHTNYREAAQRGAALFAEALPEVLGISPRVPTPAEGPESRGAWRAVIWGLLLIAAVLFGYLYMNTGSVEGAVDQVRNLFSRINSKINRKE
ncbi:MAG TPA: stage II sporulation protein P [Syntrophomonadaceae bacterium]|nr:stage II sporulation protein P [Syntrophomonadaceae bacterium]